MAITKEIVEDKIEVVGDYKAIQVRTATVIKEDGVGLQGLFIDTWCNAQMTSASNQQKSKPFATLYGRMSLKQPIKSI